MSEYCYYGNNLNQQKHAHISHNIITNKLPLYTNIKMHFNASAITDTERLNNSRIHMGKCGGTV